jgi:putative iron-dependent peroxidase
MSDLVDGRTVVVGLGASCAQVLGRQIPGLHELQALEGPGASVPATPTALCCWLRGNEPGELLHLTRQLEHALVPALELTQVVDAFRYGRGPNGFGRDLTGYEDGIENPQGREARREGLVHGQGAGLDGGSLVAVQIWEHDLDTFEAMPERQRDHVFGRRQGDSEELDEAPASAHVKRTAQESFTPEAFVVRRSMPWAEGSRAGLVFVAFGHSLDAFEVQLRHMCGLDDGITDGLFSFSKPLTSASFWCPPLRDGRLDLSQLGP